MNRTRHVVKVGLPNADKSAIDKIYARRVLNIKVLHILYIPHTAAGTVWPLSVLSSALFLHACYYCDIQAWFLNKKETIACFLSVYNRRVRNHRHYGLNASDVDEFQR